MYQLNLNLKQFFHLPKVHQEDSIHEGGPNPLILGSALMDLKKTVTAIKQLLNSKYSELRGCFRFLVVRNEMFAASLQKPAT